MYHGAHVVDDSCVGEPKDGKTVELQLNVALPVGLETHRVTVFRAVEFHDASLR
jgi:hypothetical protein